MKIFAFFGILIGLGSFSARAVELDHESEQLAQWICVARTSVLQKAFTGEGDSEAAARAAALQACQAEAVFGCYVQRCDPK